MKKIYLTFVGLISLSSLLLSQTVHTVLDTSYNSDNSHAYYIEATTVTTATQSTLTLNISPATSNIGQIFDLSIYRDTDARFKDRPRIAKSVQVPANGTVIFEDMHETWTNDGGGLYQYTGTGAYPSSTPQFYSFAISRLEEDGGTSRPRRTYPAIYLPNDPTEVVQDVINEDMTLITQVFPDEETSSAILKLDFAPDYTYYQGVLAEALPGEPLYPAGDKLVFFGNVFVNSTDTPEGRTNIEYGNLYWGHEGSAYAKISIDPSLIGADGKAYVWFSSGRPGVSTTEPIPVQLSSAPDPNGQTVHTVLDTSYNSDNSHAYYIEATTVTTATQSTLTLNISPATSNIGQIFDLSIYRDTDARFKDRPRIAKSVQVPANGTVIFEDMHETWTNDGGGLYQYTGTGAYPSSTPQFYSFAISRLEEDGGTSRPRRTYPAIYLPNDPTEVVQDVINEDMTLITQVFPDEETSSAILKLDFAPDYTYYQGVLAEALPGEPLYPAGDKLVFFGNVFVNSTDTPEGRTNIEYGNLYWGHEGSAYAKISIDPSLIGADGKAYVWFSSGRPGVSTTEPIPVQLSSAPDPNGQTVHTVLDTSYNSDNSHAYYIEATTVTTATQSTLTLNISPATSNIGQIFDLSIYRDTDARFKDRPRIAKSVQVPANGTVIFEDMHETWTNDGGGLYQYTGTGAYPSSTPQFYSFAISRLEEDGGTSRPRRTYPAIYLPNDPTEVVQDVINEDMTLITQVFPDEETSSAILKLDFAPDYTYYQRVLAEALPGEPLYPAGDKLVFFGNVFVNSTDTPEGRTNIEYGNLYWGHEGSAYAKISIDPSLIGADGKAYVWFSSGRPGVSTTEPIPVQLGAPTSTAEVAALDLKVYPNPTNGIINIEGQEKIKHIAVFTLTGQSVYASNIEFDGFASVDISDFPKGVYYLRIQAKEGFMTQKIIKL